MIVIIKSMGRRLRCFIEINARDYGFENQTRLDGSTGNWTLIWFGYHQKSKIEEKARIIRNRRFNWKNREPVQLNWFL